MSEPEVRRSASKGTTLERDRSDVLDAARPLPPDADVLIDDLTEDEDRIFRGMSVGSQGPVGIDTGVFGPV